MIVEYNGNEIHELTLEQLNPEKFIEQKIQEISDIVGNGTAINALSGGVDSAVVTMLGHAALGNRLKTYFIDNGLMREGEPEYVAQIFRDLGVPVEIKDAKDIFFDNLKGFTHPEDKRNAITDSFYRHVLAELIRYHYAKYIMHGTNYTDIAETVAGIKRQHNIITQIGIDPEKAYGYKVIEPILQLRKPAVRVIAKQSGLPEEIYNRMPFPGPALAARILGEVTREKVEIVRKATAIVEYELKDSGAAQYLAILHDAKVTGIRDGKRDYGHQIEVRCWDSEDFVTAKPTMLPFGILEKLAERITTEVPGVVSVTYNITSKPISTIEVV